MARSPTRGPRRPRGLWTPQERANGSFLPVDAMQRFREKCRFEPETGCVVWIGGTTMGRGHHVPYPAFWFEGRRWLGHRWAAKYIHGLEIDGLQVDHCCPHVPLPNTLCVEHVQVLTLEQNRWLQTERRRAYVHMQVGLLAYEDVYGPPPSAAEELDIPWFSPPSWLGNTGELRATDERPF